MVLRELMTALEFLIPDWFTIYNPVFIVLLLPGTIVVLVILAWASRWLLFLSLSCTKTIFQFGFASYQLFRIMTDLALLSMLKLLERLQALQLRLVTTPTSSLRQKLLEAQSYEDYIKIANEIDEKEGMISWKYTDEGFPQQKILQQATESLRHARRVGDHQQLKFLVASLMKRNHLGIEDADLYNKCFKGTKIFIETFLAELEESLHYLADLPEEIMSLYEKFRFFRKASKSIGQSALCLSGGGAIAMYHVGVIAALIKTGLFKHIKVTSGTSGGSIIAAMCASRTDEEFLEQVCVPTAATDFHKDGVMKRENIRWFPPLWDQALRYLRTGYLVDNKAFQRTCEYYYGDMTFAEAYEKSRRHVCIPITASRCGMISNAPDKLLLNHISTPHVLLRSAVAASCALPGIMAPNSLLAKNAAGEIVPFEIDGHEWIDGSIRADVPYRRMAALFAVSNFLVSQMNFHVLPFIGHRLRHTSSAPSFTQQVMTAIDLDLKHRTQVLAQLGLMPKLYGQDISKIFNQKYHGNVTIVPDLHLTESLGLAAIMNPSPEFMINYIRGGQLAAWPHIERIHHMIAVESTIYDCMQVLLSRRARLRSAGTVPRGIVTAKSSKDSQEEEEDKEELPLHTEPCDMPSLEPSMSASDFIIYGSGSDDESAMTVRSSIGESSIDLPAVMQCNGKQNGQYEAGSTRRWRRRVEGEVHSLLYGNCDRNNGTHFASRTNDEEYKKVIDSLQARIAYLEGVAAKVHDLEVDNKKLRDLLEWKSAEVLTSSN